MLAEFVGHVGAHQLFQKNDQLLVAVSGGADSVALCELCFRAGYHFEMAHCNFQLRGEESERDENFVVQLAAKLGVKLHRVRFDTFGYSKEKKVSVEVAARELRYNWFDGIIGEMKARGAAFLLTAHHREDNIETLLMNFFKGTGIRGLQGIPEKNGYIRRPLLFATRRQIEQFLAESQVAHVEDSTNLNSDYTRNFFRNKLLPELEKVFPAVRENLQDNISRNIEIGQLYQEAVNCHLKGLMLLRGEEIHIPVLKLVKSVAAKTLLYEMVKGYGFIPAQLPDILHLTKSHTGSYVASRTHRIIRNRNWLIITPVKTESSEHIVIEAGQGKIPFRNGMLTIEQKSWSGDRTIPTSSDTAFIDAKDLVFPLILRPWKEGDYFYPLGMSKKKKLSRFFIDLKLSVSEKEKVWVIEQDSKIIWVVNYRIDNRYKITPATASIFVIQYTKGLEQSYNAV